MTKPGKTFDLNDLNLTAACNKPIEIELKHPVTQQPLGMFISLVGKESDAFKEHFRDTVNEDNRKAAALAAKGREPEVLTLEQREARGTELLAAITVGWRNIQWGGKEFEFNSINAFKLYSEYGWIRDQVDRACADIEGFMKG